MYWPHLAELGAVVGDGWVQDNDCLRAQPLRVCQAEFSFTLLVTYSVVVMMGGVGVKNQSWQRVLKTLATCSDDSRNRRKLEADLYTWWLQPR